MNIFRAIANKGEDILENAHVRAPWQGEDGHEHMMADPVGYLAKRRTERSGARSRRNIMVGGFAQTILFAMTGGVYLTGFLLSLGADAGFVNTVVILLNACVIIQLFAPALFERVRRRRRIIFPILAINHALTLFVVPLLVLAGTPNEVMLPLFCVLVTVAGALGALIMPGMSAWHIGNIPEEKRLGYFALSTIAGVIVSSSAPFLGGIAVDTLKGIWGESASLAVIRLVLLFFAAMQMFFYYRVDEPEYPKSTEKNSLGGVLRSLKAHPGYLKVILALAVWNLSAVIPGQYFIAYLLEDLSVSYTFITSISLAFIAAIIFLTPVWKRLIARFRLHNAFSSAMMLYALYPAGCLFVSAATLFIYPVSVIFSYMFAVCLNLCISMAPYINLPEENRTLFLSVYNVAQALAQICGLFIGRVIYDACSGMGLPFGIEPARVLMGVLSVMIAFSGFVIRFALRPRAEAREA